MTLILNNKEIYVDPYRTNWHYLQDMTSLQMKALNGMAWTEAYKEISVEFWPMPKAWSDKKYSKASVKDFMNALNDKIMRL